jgi:hypothetical protein
LARRRAQKGEAVSALLVLAAFVIEGIIFAGVAAVGFIRVSVADRQVMQECLRKVKASNLSLIRRFGPTGDVPVDDPDAIAIKECKARLDGIMSRVQLDGGVSARNAQTAIDEAIQSLGRCDVVKVTPRSATAGVTRSLKVEATLPFGGERVSGTINVLTADGTRLSGRLVVQTSMGIRPGALAIGSGEVAVPDAVSRVQGASVSKVTVSAQASLGQARNGRCPGLITPTASGECVLSCPAGRSSDVVWRDPPIPHISLFRAIPSTVVRGRVEPIFLVWNVKDAKSIEIDQGIGEVDKAGSWFEFPPDMDTTYTLTARAVLDRDTRTATAKVTVQEPPSLTLVSPGNNTTVTDEFADVSGTVSNLPGAMVEISVNGVRKHLFAVDGGGNFAASAALDKRITLFDLSAPNPNLLVTSCGPQSTDIVVGNGKSLADVTNVITVNVAGASPPLTASGTVFHAVRVTRFRVNWNTCPPLNKDEALDIVLGAGQSMRVGTVDCGTNAPVVPPVSCSVTSSVDTSVGGIDDDATWTFDVPSCP